MSHIERIPKEGVIEGSPADGPFRVGVCAYSNAEARIVAEELFEPRANVVLGDAADARPLVPGWSGQNLLLISDGTLLHLMPGMRLHMCNEGGTDRVVGTFEELVAQGMSFPLRVGVTMLNVRVREGLSVFVRYLPSSGT